MRELDVPARAIVPIPSIEKPDPDLFEREYARRSVPVIIKGVASEWPACGQWPMERLVSECGRNLVNITRYVDNSSKGSQFVRMRVGEFVKSLTEPPRENGDVLAWNGEFVSQTLPQLARELRLPYLVRPNRSHTVAFMAGPRQWPYRHVSNQFHYHPGLHAFAAQIQGRKLFRLYSPAETRCLYPVPWWRAVPSRSTIEIHRDDFTRFPRLGHAVCQEAWLETGDLLFIPSGWWHLVANESFAIVITTFYPAPFLQWRLASIPGIGTCIDRLRRRKLWKMRKAPGHLGLITSAAPAP